MPSLSPKFGPEVHAVYVKEMRMLTSASHCQKAVWKMRVYIGRTPNR